MERRCGFGVNDNLIKVCKDLGKSKINNKANLIASNSTTGIEIRVNVTITLGSLIQKLGLLINETETYCCSLDKNKIQIELPISGVKIPGTIRERKLELIAFNQMIFIPSPELVSDNKFLLIEVEELAEEAKPLDADSVERNIPSKGENVGFDTPQSS